MFNFLCHQLHEIRGDPICTKEDTPEALNGRLGCFHIYYIYEEKGIQHTWEMTFRIWSLGVQKVTKN